MSFFRGSDLKTRQVLEGITLRAVAGDKTMMAFFEFKPNAVIPSHKHPLKNNSGSATDEELLRTILADQDMLFSKVFKNH